MQNTTSSSKLDQTLVNSISSATEEVLNTMASTEIRLINISATQDYSAYGDISAILGITGDGGEGMVSLSFPLGLANILVSRLLMTEPASVSSSDRCDGIGELANMISGKAKMVLSENAASPYKLSLPTVILGSGHEVTSRPKNSPYLIFSFEAEGQPFYLQLSFKST